VSYTQNTHNYILVIVISLTNTTGSDVDNVAVADSLPRLCRDGVGET